MQDKIQKWLINWFMENTGADETELNNSIEENYFLKGFIDSFQFIELISDIEDEYGIEFDNSQFEDRSFSSIRGLSQIISQIGGYSNT